MHDLLAGVRILDLTTIVLGPYATQTLGDLGAEVIKVEPLDGDLFRSVRPGHSDTMGAGYLNSNRNKRSIAIDLSRPESHIILNRLVSGVDVVTHNMRPKSAEKLGVGYDRLRAIKPDIVYAYACGFGTGGEYEDQPAYDDIIQAVSGLAHLNADAAGEPRFLPTIIGDKVVGLHLAIAILAGLASKARTGQGVCVEAPMFESMVSFLMLEQLAGRSFEPNLGGTGYARLSSPYRRPFATGDGYISVLPYTGTHWSRFLTLIGREDLATDPRVLDPVQRSGAIDMLYAVIENAVRSRTTAQWLVMLRAVDVPCAEVNRLEDLFNDPHLRSVGMFQAVDHDSEGPMMGVRSPFNVSDRSIQPDRPAPRLAQDTDEILMAAGFARAEINNFRDLGVLRADPTNAETAR